MVTAMYKDKYGSEQFVRILDNTSLPATQFVRGSNYCDIGFHIDRRTNRITVMSAIDNIVKGAAGQAVQNMNILTGLNEEEGLTGTPFFP
jgi:N-acetyl-gamma-glutamyl-phosphate reductase